MLSHGPQPLAPAQSLWPHFRPHSSVLCGLPVIELRGSTVATRPVSWLLAFPSKPGLPWIWTGCGIWLVKLRPKASGIIILKFEGYLHDITLALESRWLEEINWIKICPPFLLHTPPPRPAPPPLTPRPHSTAWHSFIHTHLSVSRAVSSSEHQFCFEAHGETMVSTLICHTTSFFLFLYYSTLSLLSFI